MTEAAAVPSRFRPTLFHLALVVPWIALVVNSIDRISDNSFLWHIRAGTMQIDAGRVLTADPFSFTMAGQSWRTQSWLAELAYGWFETTFGMAFAGWFLLSLSVITFAGLSLISYRYSKSVPATAVVLLLSTVLMSSFLVPRPVLISYPLFVVVILAWDGKQWRWAMPFLFWIWASVHGSFVIGLAYVGIRLLQTKDWHSLPAVAVSGLATLVTAHGFGIFSMLWSFAMARPYLGLISEWQTPSFVDIDLLPLLIGVLLIVYGATNGRVAASALWILAPFLTLAASAERAVASAWIALIPLVAVSLRDMHVRWSRGFPPGVAAAFGLLIFALPFAFTNPVEISAEEFPVGAAEHLGDIRTFHDDYAGGFLIFHRGPEFPVYIDDRAELYQERTQEFVDLRAGRTDWRAHFARDGIEQVMLRDGEPLVRQLQADGWTSTYSDDRYVILRPADQQ